MAPIVYTDLLSPCSRAVALVVRKAGLESSVTLKDVFLLKHEHRAPEFIKKFPLHTVPTLEDDGFYLWDSHAIAPYIVSTYALDDALYPKDTKKRAKVDQWLHYSNAILYNRLRDMTEPLWLRQRKDVPDERKQRCEDAIKNLETLLGDNPWLCGDELTLADISCACEVVGAMALLGDLLHLEKLHAWLDRCQDALPGYKEINLDYNDKYKAAIEERIASWN